MYLVTASYPDAADGVGTQTESLSSPGLSGFRLRFLFTFMTSFLSLFIKIW